MRLDKLIERLNRYQEKSGNVMLMEVKIVFPEQGEHSYLNSVKDKTKKMSLKEYVKLCNEGYWSEVENDN